MRQITGGCEGAPEVEMKKWATPGLPGHKSLRGIAINLPEARLNEALAADAFACSVSAVCR